MKKILLLIILIIHFSCLFSWEIVSEMPYPVYGGEAVVHNSLIYIFGGYSDALNNALDVIQIYDPVGNSWSISDYKLNLTRYGHSIYMFNNNLYLFGGGFDDSTSLNFSMERWDFASALSISNYSYTLNRIFSTAVIADSDLYIFGGYPNFSAKQDSMLEYLASYNVITNEAVTLLDTFPENRDSSNYLPSGQMSAMVNNDKILVFGGDFYGVSNNIYCFNINDHSFEVIGTLLEPRTNGKALSIDDYAVLLIGGYNEQSEPLISIEEYHYYSDYAYLYTSGDRLLNYPRSELMAVMYNNYIYIFGGKNENAAVKSVEKMKVSEVANGMNNVSNNNLAQFPTEFQLNNYPNPFNSSTVIEFYNMSKCHIQLEIYSITGKRIKSIISQELNKGSYHFSWDGTDSAHDPVASGIYLCRIKGNNRAEAKRLLLLR